MTDTHPSAVLTGEDLETWAGLATVLEWLPPALDAPLGHNFGLTHFEYGILYALEGAPDRTLRMSDLAGFANSSLSRLSRAVSRLQSRGFVDRSPDPKDGRSTRATLTDAGQEMIHEATPRHVASVRRLVLDPLTVAQKRQLREITVRIQQAIRAQDGWRPPQATHPPAGSVIDSDSSSTVDRRPTVD
ncbi:MarR family winged helix-turn-helix transcriptional regulator [Arthrobacter agilis]|uniref:MarR family winged helix-turn-helix transcriptional regulator n=1 Tax=Arthrobacter agilis TaxID=37921 RepID=UPI00278787B6|nr:MarR family transcriptional regulator [Arthrobacter agilis]MDQ0734715.1 DNA-binding MarR family transcriptional regulator [Arthrobacter agilis]